MAARAASSNAGWTSDSSKTPLVISPSWLLKISLAHFTVLGSPARNESSPITTKPSHFKALAAFKSFNPRGNSLVMRSSFCSLSIPATWLPKRCMACKAWPYRNWKAAVAQQPAWIDVESMSLCVYVCMCLRMSKVYYTVLVYSNEYWVKSLHLCVYVMSTSVSVYIYIYVWIIIYLNYLYYSIEYSYSYYVFTILLCYYVCVIVCLHPMYVCLGARSVLLQDQKTQRSFPKIP